MSCRLFYVTLNLVLGIACTDTKLPQECADGCPTEKPLCSETLEKCVECLANTDCPTSAASRCAPEEQTCAPCEEDADCGHLTGQPYCNPGTHSCVASDCSDPANPIFDPDTETCVECTIATEADRCGDNSCNPATDECTDTPRGETGVCKPCVADSECAANHRCVPMEFQGTARDNAYCLQVVSDEACPLPFKVTIEASSLSGTAEVEYCGINQDLTTCEGVNHARVTTDCSDDMDCGAEGLNDGLCRDFGGAIGDICTYECSSAIECPTGRACNSTPEPDYCDKP